MAQVVQHCAGLLFEPFGEVPAHRLEDARHEQARREGEEQSQEAARQVGTRQCPAHPQVTVAGEDEEEVHRQVAVVELLVVGAGGKRLEEVIPDYHDGRHAAQSVQDAVVRLGICECCGRYF